MAFRLTYHALALDTRQPDAIMRLSDFLDFPGVQGLSVAVLEYGCSDEIGLSPQERAPIEALRFRAQWYWGFSRHQSGRTELLSADFEDRSQFDLDEKGYEASMAPAVAEAGSLYNAFRAAHTLLGGLAGLLKHRDPGTKAMVEDAYFPERFVHTPEYVAWLSLSAEELDRLDEERVRLSHGTRP
jgi:hypothetical protein